MKNYKVKNTDYSLKRVADLLPDSIWNDAILLEDFSQPWSNHPSYQTNFRALFNDKFLYLRYDVKDENVLISKMNNNKLDVAKSDRVEIFFRKNEKLDEYYCIEVDPDGRVLDYIANFYRKFNLSWSWPKKHLFTKGIRLLDGYRVDIVISLESLIFFDLLKGNLLEVGIYRANCISLSKNDQKESDIKWITWVDPKTELPDFHIPSSFGILNLNN